MTRQRRKVKVELSPVELSHLYNVLAFHRDEGSYWGRKDQHYKRTEQLLDQLLFAMQNNPESQS